MEQKFTTFTVLCLLVIIFTACTPAVPPTITISEAPDPTRLIPTPTLSGPSDEPVRSRFLYIEGVSVSTLAGDGYWGYRDGPGLQAHFNGPEGVAVDGQGNVYVAERFGDRIRRIGPDGTVSTLAGTGAAGFMDGPATSAQFSHPYGILIDETGNLLVADTFNHRIRIVHPDGTVSTLAGDGTAGYRDGPASQARFDRPTGLALSPSGVLYVADAGNNRVRTISPDGMVTTLAGSGEQGFMDGPPDEAQFNGPQYLAVGPKGNVYASDSVSFELRGNSAIRRITPEGMVTTIAGTGLPGRVDGEVANAGFFDPCGLIVDTTGNLYIADDGNQRIRVITPEGMVYTLAGRGTNGYVDGAGSQAAFLNPHGIALDGEGRLYVADVVTSRIRVIQVPQTLIASPPPPTTDPYAGQNVIKIGFVDESGRGSFFSSSTGNAIQIAIDEANVAGGVLMGDMRYTFVLVRAQDWLQPPDAGAQAAAHALIDQGVVAVVGHLLSENSIAGAEVYGPAGVVMVTVVSSDPRVTQAGWSTVYRVTSNDAYMAPVAARMTYEQLGLRRAVLLGETDPHVQTAMDAWQEAFVSLGGQILGRFEGEVEFSEEVIAQIRDLVPEAVIFFPGRNLSIAKAAQQVLDTNLNSVIIGVESFSVDPTLLATFGERGEGIYDAVPGKPRTAMPGYANFAERYEAAGFAIIPDPDHSNAKFNPSAYDAANIIITAIRQAAEMGEVTPQSVAAAMETFRHQPYQGLTGAIQFDEFGDLLVQPVYLKRVVNGQWVDIVP